MKYFVIRKPPPRETDPICSCSFLEVCPSGLSFSLGLPLPVELPTPIEYECDESSPIPDYPHTNMSQCLVSEAAYLLMKEKSSCVCAYKSTIRHHGKIVERNYWTINFEEAHRCLDRQASTFEAIAGSERVGNLTKIVISNIPTSDHIFRLFEKPGVIICSSHFKALVEEKGLTGFEFAEVSS